MLSHILRELLLPPSSLLALFLAAALLHRRQPRVAAALATTAALLLYGLGLPPVAYWLSRSTEQLPAQSLAQIRAYQPQIIVVLGAGVDLHSPEYGGLTVPSQEGLKRLTYAAYLSRELGLPILTTGGYGPTPADSEGQAAATHLQGEKVGGEILVEATSANTAENARHAAAIIEGKGLTRALVVTHASHAARAKGEFDRAGLPVLVAPTGYRTWQPWERGPLLLIPTHNAFDESCYALRCHLAMLWQLLRG